MKGLTQVFGLTFLYKYTPWTFLSLVTRHRSRLIPLVVSIFLRNYSSFRFELFPAGFTLVELCSSGVYSPYIYGTYNDKR